MTVTDNVALLKRWFQEVWNEGRIETIHEIMAPEAIARGQYGPNQHIRGPEEFEEFVDRIRGSFSEMRVNVEDIFGVDDKVVLRWSGEMTHTGDALGFPATNKRIKVSGITIARFANGQIVEGWDNWDQLAMLEQLGVYKQPEATLPLAS
jgi:steroid delta-isomerase-like uncharacterized protein